MENTQWLYDVVGSYISSAVTNVAPISLFSTETESNDTNDVNTDEYLRTWEVSQEQNGIATPFFASTFVSAAMGNLTEPSPRQEIKHDDQQSRVRFPEYEGPVVDLPPELQCMILDYLTVETILSFDYVCKSWYNFVTDHWISCKRIVLSDRQECNPKESLNRIFPLIKMHNISVLDVSRCMNINLGFIENMPNITKLYISGLNLKENHLGIIGNKMKRLRVLVMSNTNITGQWLKHLVHLRDLQVLNMNYCYSLTDEGISYLSWLTSLNDLSLVMCIKLTAEAVLQLSSVKSLQHLNLSNISVTDDVICKLRKSLPTVNLKLVGSIL